MRLTAFSHGAGCGCKIAPDVLSRILAGAPPGAWDGLLVGNEGRDDAAVLAIDDERCLVSTTDFFMPIVDDPYDFGRIAAINAISDVWAMGGRPVLAIAILGWPVDKLPPEAAGDVVRGGRDACAEVGIPLAGGHSIDCPEPLFGLAVTGLVARRHVKRNAGARPGDVLLLTKPLGVGILTTAQKRGLLRDGHAEVALRSMLAANRAGERLAAIDGVHAMTDVTGFGLLGHALEVADASGVGIRLHASAVPTLVDLAPYLAQGCWPGGTLRNLRSVASRVRGLGEPLDKVLADPQTSGGLLVAVDPADEAAAVAACELAVRVGEVVAGEGIDVS